MYRSRKRGVREKGRGRQRWEERRKRKRGEREAKNQRRQRGGEEGERERGQGESGERIKEKAKELSFIEPGYWLLSLFTFLNFIYPRPCLCCAVCPLLWRRLLLLWPTGPRERGCQQLWCSGLAVPQHVGSSLARDRTHVPCVSRQIFNHWTTRETTASLVFWTSSSGWKRGTPGLGGAVPFWAADFSCLLSALEREA